MLERCQAHGQPLSPQVLELIDEFARIVPQCIPKQEEDRMLSQWLYLAQILLCLSDDRALLETVYDKIFKTIVTPDSGLFSQDNVVTLLELACLTGGNHSGKVLEIAKTVDTDPESLLCESRLKSEFIQLCIRRLI